MCTLPDEAAGQRDRTLSVNTKEYEMQRKHLALLAPIAAIALVATGCTSNSPAASPSSAGGDKDTLTLAFETDPYGWDPSSQPGYQNWQAEAVWDTLAFCGAD